MTRTAARLPRNSRSPSCINKLRNKLIDTLADVEKLSKALLEEESAMMGVVPMEEQQSVDYLPLMTKLKIRFSASKLACVGAVDVAEVFAWTGLVGDGEGKASEASLREVTGPKAVALLTQPLQQRKLPLPIAGFGKCQSSRGFDLRVSTVGEAAGTAQDLKEAKAKFIAHIDGLIELVRPTRRAGDDVSARRTLKL